MEEILIVDADHLAHEASEVLRGSGYRPELVADGESALSRFHAGRLPALVLLELELPGLRGPEVLRRIRRDEATQTLPVIATSSRPDEIDRVLAFELGADDFIQKPFSLRELALRVKAVLRRSGTTTPRALQEQVSTGPLQLDPSTRSARVMNRDVPLTAIEQRLLFTLAERLGQVCTREELLERVWMSPHVGIRTVDTHVRRLREKLGEGADCVETVRGVGYRLRSGASRSHNADT